MTRGIESGERQPAPPRSSGLRKLQIRTGPSGFAGGHGVANEKNILLGWGNLCIKGQIVNIAGFADHMVSAIGA